MVEHVVGKFAGYFIVDGVFFRVESGVVKPALGGRTVGETEDLQTFSMAGDAEMFEGERNSCCSR